MSELGHPHLRAVLLALEIKGGGFLRGSGPWDVRCPCPGHSHNDAGPSGRVFLDGNKIVTHCYRKDLGHTWDQWVRHLDVPESFWFFGPLDAQARQWKPKPVEIAARYKYQDENGRELYQVVRTEPKGFWQERVWENPDVPGERLNLMGLNEGWYVQRGGRWRWGGTQPPKDCTNARFVPAARRVLYHLPEVNDAAVEDPVYFVEGEKDCDLVRSLGLVATTTAQGAANFSVGVIRPVAGRHLVVIPDNDAQGYKHAACVAGSAVMCRAASVRVAIWRKGEVPPKGDFGDWFKAQGWPSGDDVRKRFYEGSEPFGLLDVDASGDVVPR